MLLLPDRHGRLEGVDQMCACRERLTAVDRADSHNDGDVANLQVTHAMLHRDRENIMLISVSSAATGERPRRWGAGCSRAR
jgi:hypothetical protein